MRTFLLTLSAAALASAGLAAAAPAAEAATSSRQEAIGITTGGVVGALAGGPIGFFFGAAIGATLGDRLDRQDAEIETLTASIGASRRTIDGLESDVDRLTNTIERTSAKLAELKRLSRPELMRLLQAGIEMDLLFRTDEHVLLDATGVRLSELAASLATMPEVRVRLDGFADERGDETYNQALSNKRVEFVRQKLVAAGIDPARIVHTAHGEAPAVDDRLDSLALERRVSVRLFVTETDEPEPAEPSSMASNPQ